MANLSKLTIGLGVGTVACAIGGWVIAAPYLSAQALQTALVKGDGDAAIQKINFPLLRESLKTQVGQYITEQAQNSKDPNAAASVVMAQAMMGPMVDGFVTPDMLKMTLKGQTPKIPGMTPESAPAEAKGNPFEALQKGNPEEQPEVSMGYSNPNRFLVKVADKKDAAKKITLVFGRDGLDWKLSEVKLPMDQMK
jgi:Protein of unknown function (DUF2939)